MHIPAGFQFAGFHCGIKKASQIEDISLVVAADGAVAAGTYTQNLVCAAPVVVDRERTPSSDVRVIVTNSGNANACTGQQGMADALRMTELAAAACGVSAEQVLVMSTGIIGEFLPMENIARGIQSAAGQLGTCSASLTAAARGILTTDTHEKIVTSELQIEGQPIRLAGFAKGAGMIGPRMATLLGVMTTDANLGPEDAQRWLSQAVDRSFNCISVEGHMSTNDTILLLASGKSGPKLAGAALESFGQALTETCIQLAQQIPNDGEGASHLIEIHVTGCRSEADGRSIARSIADSPLVKTAITGADPNWGRIVSAAGYAGVEFQPADVGLVVNGIPLFERGTPLPFDEAAASQSIKENRTTRIELTVGSGPASSTFWTSDLTVEYVRFNSEYHT